MCRILGNPLLYLVRVGRFFAGTWIISMIELLQNNDTQIAQQFLTLLKEVLSQNFFTFQQRIYKLEKSIATCSPISGIIAEIFLQNFENINIKQLLDTKPSILHNIRRQYFNHLWHHKSQFTHHQHIHKQYTQKHQSKPTYEQHRSIDFLDLTITSKHKLLEVDILKNRPTLIRLSFKTSHRTKNRNIQISHNPNALPISGSRQET